MISRANGNSSRGHSIMTSGCTDSCGTFWMRNTPEKVRSNANRTVPAGLRLALELQRDLVVGLRQLADPDIDLDIDGRLRLAHPQRARRVRILEREVLDVLGQHIELRRLLLFLRVLAAAIGRHGHERFLRRSPTTTLSAGWLT